MPTPDDDRAFADLGLRAELLTALTDLGYEEPTPIQRAAIPPLLAGRDVLGQAATGTGKTAAFALPLLQRLEPPGRRAAPVAIVLVPTRELCMQVSQALHRYGRSLHARVLPIYGGQPIGRQLRELQSGVDIVVATPGRVLDHLGRGSLRLDAIECVVLDEADEMLDMGFAEDIESILAATPTSRQTVLFSATMPARINGIARRHLSDPIRIEIEQEVRASGAAPLVRQTAYVVARAHKTAALGRILDIEAPTAALVFCRTRQEVDELTETLNGRGYRAEALHGGMTQEHRDRVMGRLRSGTADLLVATDVAARGLDVEILTHVVNYDVPSDAQAYVHRIGRVGRAGREGVAITLAEPREHRMLKTIERVTGKRIAVEKVPTTADLRARRLELTREALYETLLDDQLDAFRVVVESLSDDFDVMQVALAAVKLAHESTGAVANEDEIPESAPPVHRDDHARRGGASYSTGQSGRASAPPRSSGARPARASTAAREGSPGAGARSDRQPSPRRGSTAGDARAASGAVTVFVGAGRQAGIRPQDLVGAIANETQLSGKDIGAIDIADRFSLVEVPADAAREVIAALRATRLKGNRVQVRLDRDSAH